MLKTWKSLLFGPVLLNEFLKSVNLVFEATIADQWHLYSLEEFEDGPLPTEFTFVFDSLKVQLVGKISSGTPKVEFDQIFLIDLPYFDSKARFTQSFSILDPTANVISGGDQLSSL